MKHIFRFIVDLLIFTFPMKFPNAKISPANFSVVQGAS